jgi:hypothetical protein
MIEETHWSGTAVRQPTHLAVALRRLSDFSLPGLVRAFIPLFLAGCGGGDAGTTVAPPPPPPPAVVAAVEVSPASQLVLPGGTVQLAATPRSATGVPLAGRSTSWRSEHPAIASVTSSGLVTGLAAGTATIVATVEGVSGNAQITVASPAARVVLERDTVVLARGATSQLSAEVRDAQGRPLSGRSITWSTTVPGVATISSTGLVTAVQSGQARVIATVEAVADTALLVVAPGTLALTLGTPSAVTRTVGPAGDTLRATASDGTVYTLAIPPAALAQPVAITMTPITAAQDLPLSGGLAGGVDLKPSGTRFLFPASLSISTSRSPGQGERVVGFSYAGNGEKLQLEAAAIGGSVITIPVPHFSGVGAGFGTAQDIAVVYLAGLLNPTSAATYMAALVNAMSATPRDPLVELGIYLNWFDALVLPGMQSVSTDVQLVAAIATRNEWAIAGQVLGLAQSLPQGVNHPNWAARRQQWNTVAATRLRAAIQGNLALCSQPGLASARVTALDNAIFWHRIADVYTLATSANGLDLPWLQANLCATVVAEGIALADPLAAGANHLDLTFKLSFTNGQVTVPSNFFVTPNVVSGTGVLPTATAATPPGNYAGTVTPAANGGARVELQACYAGSPATIFLPTGAADELCGLTVIQRGAAAAQFSIRHFSQVRFEPDDAGTCGSFHDVRAGVSATLSNQGACNLLGAAHTGRATLAGSPTKLTLESRVTRQSHPTGLGLAVAQAFSTLTDRITINAPGRTGTPGVMRFRLEVTGSLATTGPCASTDQISSAWTVVGRVQAQAQAGQGDQVAFAAVRGIADACASQSSGPPLPVTLVSADVSFTYGTPFHLYQSLQAISSTNDPSPGVATASTDASVVFRWLGIQGLEPGATLTSASGIDWRVAHQP